ncbi:hypothetical protein EVAR_49677_1 [Eumeta japonica]|uniref:Uncharacterized protein n=1 Tax=Eumeta variegata TaxID=151549 RepID=A0A4C1WRL5_EUMVA|nr:hypothetical protein EVAR_49677_1 [Eumeta japonica]
MELNWQPTIKVEPFVYTLTYYRPAFLAGTGTKASLQTDISRWRHVWRRVGSQTPIIESVVKLVFGVIKVAPVSQKGGQRSQNISTRHL